MPTTEEAKVQYANQLLNAIADFPEADETIRMSYSRAKAQELGNGSGRSRDSRSHQPLKFDAGTETAKRKHQS